MICSKIELRSHTADTNIIVQLRYDEIAKISPLDGLHADLHELAITTQDTGMMNVYEIYRHQVS